MNVSISIDSGKNTVQLLEYAIGEVVNNGVLDHLEPQVHNSVLQSRIVLISLAKERCVQLLQNGDPDAEAAIKVCDTALADLVDQFV